MFLEMAVPELRTRAMRQGDKKKVVNIEKNRSGNFLDLYPDSDSSNFVDPDPDTINPDPHHWIIR